MADVMAEKADVLETSEVMETADTTETSEVVTTADAAEMGDALETLASNLEARCIPLAIEQWFFGFS
jgi:hypothetical protein